GDYGPSRALLPVGMATSGAEASAVLSMISAPLDRLGPDGQPLYPRRIARLNEVADGVAVIRNGLTAYADGNAVVVLAGNTANLNAMLHLPDGSHWAAVKPRV